MVEFSDDENKVTVGASRYRAETSKIPGKCGICAFKVGFGCDLTEAVLRDRPGAYMVMGLPRCQSAHRADGRCINWVLDI